MSTLTAPERPSEVRPSLSEELDALIPPSMSPVKKFLVSLTLLAITIAFATVVNRGYLHPSAFAADDYVFSQVSHVDRHEGTFAVVVSLRNTSARTVRLTEVHVDAPGAELVRVTLSEPQLKHPRVGNGFIINEAAPADDGPQPNLPAELKPRSHFDDFFDDEYVLTLWLRPISCQTTTSEWGSLELTVDFGKSATKRDAAQQDE